MNNKSRNFLSNPFTFLAACAVFMLAGIMLLAWLGSPPVSPAIGKPLPELHLAPLLNTENSIASESLQGKTVLLYLWGPWNRESRLGVRRIGELALRLSQNPRIQVVLVACPKDELGLEELRESSRESIEGAEISGVPVYYDPSGMTCMELALLMPYGSLGFPTTILADANGKVVRVVEGSSESEIAELEKDLMENAKP